jgi:inhibitor of cysteine peptidase
MEKTTIHSSILFLVIISLLTISCKSYKKNTTQTLPIDAQKISVTVGNQFEISLKSNPTTGYSWEFVEPVDERFLNLIDETYVQNPAPEEMVGVGGKKTWTFTALEPGSTTIELIYKRPWLKEDETAKKCLITVTIYK